MRRHSRQILKRTWLHRVSVQMSIVTDSTCVLLFSHFLISQIPLPVVKQCSETTAALSVAAKLTKFPRNNRISLPTYRCLEMFKIPNSQTWKKDLFCTVLVFNSGSNLCVKNIFECQCYIATFITASLTNTIYKAKLRI